MHEYSIVGALVERVAREAESRHGHVQRVHVAIGAMAGVDLELLRTAYDTFRAETVCAHADLVVREVAADWRCRGCGMSLVDGMPLTCPVCRSPAQLVTGDEIVLERIEMEVSDV